VTYLNYEQAKAAALAALEVPRAGRLTVRQAMADYIDYLAARGKGTANTERATVAHILGPLGDLEVASLTSVRLRRWSANLAATPARRRSPRGGAPRLADPAEDEEAVRRRQVSANRVGAMLRAALNLAYAEGKVGSADEWGRRWPRFRGVDSARVRYLTRDEATRFLNGCDSEFRPLARAALETGARYSELTRLVVADFNPDSSTITIRKSKAAKMRHVALTEEGARFFLGVTTGRPGSALIFARDGGTPWKPSQQSRFTVAASARAGIAPPVNFHSLRHTWASLAVMNGVPLMVVARVLGHADTKMAEHFYAHLSPSYVTDAVRAGAPRYGTEEGNVFPLPARSKNL
jgi:integrase